MLSFRRFKYATCLAALLLVTACGSAEERSQTYYESGQKYLTSGDYARAAVEFRNALKIKEDHADAWFGMAQIEEKNQEWGRVFADLNKVLEINPKHVKAHMALATLLTLTGDNATAIEHANTAVELEPNNPDALSVKASILLKAGDKSAAEAAAQKAMGLKANHPDAAIVLSALKLVRNDAAGGLQYIDKALVDSPKNLNLHLAKLGLVEKLGDKSAIEATLRTSIATFPERPEFRSALISFLTNAGRAGDAEAELRAVMAANPENTQAGIDLVALVLKTHGAEAAKQKLTELIASEKKPFPYQMALADLEFSQGKSEESLALLKDVVAKSSIDDNGISARLKLAAQLIALKRMEEASPIISDVLKNDSQNVDALVQRAAVSIDSGKPEEAIEDLRAAMNNSLDDPKIRSTLAAAYERLGQTDLADREWNEAVKSSNFAPEWALAYAAFLVRRSNDDRAIEVLQEITRRNPTNRDAYMMLADIFSRKADWPSVNAVTEQLKAIGDDGRGADAVLARALVGQKRFDDAIPVFKRLLGDQATNIAAVEGLVKSYVAAGKLEDAQSFLTSAVKANPDANALVILQGALYLRLGKIDEAKAEFDRAVTMAPTSANGYLSLADYYSSQKKADASIEILSKGLSVATDKTPLRMALASRYERANDVESAIKQYEQVIVESPGYLTAINNLASLLSDNRTDQASLDRAASLAIVLRDSPVPALRETLGWALVRSGKLKEGLSVLERAISDLDGVGVAHAHLGLAYVQSGDTNLAKVHLARAIELGLPPAVKSVVDEKLVTLK